MLMRNDEGCGVALVFERSLLPGLRREWEALCRRCAEDSVYYAPHYMLPLLDTVAAETDVRVVTGWDGGRLIALLPVVLKRLPVPGLTAAGQAWRTDYTFNCLPLLDAGQPIEAASAILDGLSSLSCGEWLLPELNAEGAVCAAFQRALDKRNAPFSVMAKFERASLGIGQGFEEHMMQRVSSKRRRDLARNRRRLEEIGRLSLRTETAGPGLAEAVQAFLKLEASGWKGERGTALACKSNTKAFAEQAFGPSGSDGTSRVDLLLLDGQPIAAGVIVFSGTTGFTVKGAYDESYANYGAGLILEQEVIKSFLTERWARRLDAATNGSHVIDYLWPDKVSVADLVFSLAESGAATRLKTLLMTNKLASDARGRLKQMLKH